MKKVLVLGLGKSGQGAVALLVKQGKNVLGFDDSVLEKQKRESLTKSGIQLLNNPAHIDWDAIDYLVVSPGISREHIIYRTALERNIEVIGEMELALRHLSNMRLQDTPSVVAITGTNGKTTVSLLIEHILNTAGKKTRSLGNIGEPLSAYALYPDSEDPEEILVIEVSSFQIETLQSRMFDAAVILNITPDHLDRYVDMESYARAKCDLQKCLKANASFFVQHKAAEKYGHLLCAPYITLGTCNRANLYIQGEEVKQQENVEYIFPKLYKKLGMHDKENALAAWGLCKSLGISSIQFCQALETFQKPSHRMEFVCEIDGICYYDDSKGTNIDAVMRAVSTLPGPVILIVGGVDKGASYLPWVVCFKGKVKCIFALGQAAPKIYRELHLFFEIEHVDSLAMAVKKTKKKAIRGDYVLLSPGCSSYDMFRDYAHRGQEFQRYVHDL